MRWRESSDCKRKEERKCYLEKANPEWLCKVFCTHIMDSCSMLVANSYLHRGT